VSPTFKGNDKLTQNNKQSNTPKHYVVKKPPTKHPKLSKKRIKIIFLQKATQKLGNTAKAVIK